MLKTAVSALHLLRYNARDFGFHVLPASLAPRVTTGEQGHHHFERGGRSIDAPAELPDGCGTLVLVNKQVVKDRAMVVLVRPPWLIGSAELKDFAKAAVSAHEFSRAARLGRLIPESVLISFRSSSSLIGDKAHRLTWKPKKVKQICSRRKCLTIAIPITVSFSA